MLLLWFRSADIVSSEACRGDFTKDTPTYNGCDEIAQVDI